MSAPRNCAALPIAWRLGRFSIAARPRAAAVCAMLLLLALVLGVAALGMGRGGLTLARIAEIWIGGQAATAGECLLLDIRLPRVLTGLFVGAALGVSGAVFQSLSRNPLGSPDLIGFTTGAATGALLQIVLYGPSISGAALGATAGGVLTAAVVWLLARRNGRIGSQRLVLIGIGAGAMLHAVNGLLLAKGNLDNAILANLWLAGSLNARAWTHAWLAIGAAVVFIPPVLLCARRLAILETGDDLASQLGVPVERLRLGMVLCAVMLASLATGAAGPIAFIALAAPQLARRLLDAGGPPVLASAAMGACLVAAADLLGQSQPLELNLPIGKLTGLLGGIYLIWLLTRRRSA
ncbi:FecCD family ABC transporter permease [Thauera sp. SDU_THAU2]|uniref:FecCD family ABC transporter permease n=1 Tax=Thauera sp. SDU_THAU2 TaxID=3136633 RepID=UPI00311F5C48